MGGITRTQGCFTGIRERRDVCGCACEDACLEHARACVKAGILCPGFSHCPGGLEEGTAQT